MTLQSYKSKMRYTIYFAKSNLIVCTYHTDTDVGVAFSSVATIIRVFRATCITVRIPCTTLDKVFACASLRGCPFPAVAPEVDTATVAFRVCICIDRCQSALNVVGIHIHILGHVTSSKNPLVLRRQPIGVLIVLQA